MKYINLDVHAVTYHKTHTEIPFMARVAKLASRGRRNGLQSGLRCRFAISPLNKELL